MRNNNSGQDRAGAGEQVMETVVASQREFKPEKSWIGRVWPPHILIITLLALLVRLYATTWTGLTTDEANGVMLAITGSWPEMVEHLKDDGNAPLLYVLLRYCNLVFGHSDVAMKLLAVGVCTAQVPISYFICRRFLPQDLSSSVALLLAFCPTLIRYGTMIRSYALLSIIGLASTWALMRLLAKPGPWWPLCYGILNAALVYCHYWGGFLCIGQAALMAIGAVKCWFGRQQIIAFLSGATLSVLLFLPWLPILMYQLKHDVAPWDRQPSVHMMVLETIPNLLAGVGYHSLPLMQFTILLANMLIFLVLLSPRALVLGPGPGCTGFNGHYWKIVAVAGLAAGLLIDFFLPCMRYRYLMPFVPLLLIVFVTGFQQLFPRLPVTTRSVLPFLLWLTIWLPQIGYLAIQPETSTTAIVDEIKAQSDRKKDLVLISWQIIAPPINFYLPKDIAVISYPDLKRLEFNRWAGMFERLRDEENLVKLYEQLEKTLEGGGRIWLIDEAHEIRTEKDHEVVHKAMFWDAYQHRMNQIRNWLDLNAQQKGKTKMAPGRDFNVFLSVYEPRTAGSGSGATLPETGFEPGGSPPPGTSAK